MMLRTPVCSYPIIVSHLSFNFLCLLLLYSIYLNGLNCLQAREKWMKKRTSVKIRNGAANHRGNDVLVLEGREQILQVKAPACHVTSLQRDACARRNQGKSRRCLI
jgi:hypothetical protein